MITFPSSSLTAYLHRIFFPSPITENSLLTRVVHDFLLLFLVEILGARCCRISWTFVVGRRTTPGDGLKHLYANSIRSPCNRNLQGRRLLLRLPVEILGSRCCRISRKFVLVEFSAVYSSKYF